MQENISTNIQIPKKIWKSIQLKAAKDGKTMKELILEGISLVLHSSPKKEKSQATNLLLEFSGKVDVNLPKGSIQHDKYVMKNKNPY